MILALSLFGKSKNGKGDFFSAGIFEESVGGLHGGAGSPDVIQENIIGAGIDLGVCG